MRLYHPLSILPLSLSHQDIQAPSHLRDFITLSKLSLSHKALRGSGSHAYKTNIKLKHVMIDLLNWNKTEFGNIQSKIKSLHFQLQTLQSSPHLGDSSSQELLRRRELEYLLHCDSILRAQKNPGFVDDSRRPKLQILPFTDKKQSCPNEKR